MTEINPEMLVKSEELPKGLFVPRNRAERRAWAKKTKAREKYIEKAFENMAEEKKQEFYKTFYEKIYQLNKERGNNNEGTHEGN